MTVSFNLMIFLFCLRSLISKSVSSFDAQVVLAPGPISSLKMYGRDSSAVFLAKIFEVSAFALNRSSADITSEYFPLVVNFFSLT